MQDLSDKFSTSYNRSGILDEFAGITDLIEIGEIKKAQSMFLELHYADAADFLDNISRTKYKTFLDGIADVLNEDIIASLHDSNKQAFVEAVGIKKTVHLIEKLDIEDAVDVIEQVDSVLKKNILTLLSSTKRHQIIEGFTYPEDTVGRILERDFVCFNENWNVKKAIDYVRNSDIQSDFYAAIIVDNKYRPVGNILLSTLLKNNDDVLIGSIMNSEFRAIGASTQIDDLAFIFKQYALTIVPVVSKIGKLVGTVSIDNMIYIINEQTESEFLSLSGVNTSDIFAKLYQTVKYRFPWLFINLITSCITSIIINQFSDTIAELITVATIMPIVASMGGNAATQTMTLTVCAISNRKITKSNIRKILLKEVAVCFINGMILASIGVFITFILFSNYQLSFVFGIAVITNFMVAGLCGSGIPILLDIFDIDPAAASGVFLTALTDSLGFGIFLSLVRLFLL